MSAAFARSMRLLEADGSRRSLVGLSLVVIVLGAWAAWFFLVPVAVYEVSDSARLEVGQTAYPVAAPTSGMIVATHLELGSEVKQGDVLVELDSSALRLALAEKRAHLAAVKQELGPLAMQIAAQEKALGDSAAAERSSVAEAQARVRAADAEQDFAKSELERQKKLREAGLAPEADVDRAKAEVAVKKAEGEAARSAASRTDSAGRSKDSDLRASLARLSRDLATAQGQQATEEAGIATLEGEIERRQIRAPVAGKLGDIAVLQVGAVLKEGDKIGSVIPTSAALKVIADFPPASVFGVVREGQPARLKLDGFPWTQYGHVNATVLSVASEPREGRARVELSVDPASNSKIPLQHGLPGSIEIQVDRVPAATLVMRAAGQLVERKKADEGDPARPNGNAG